MKLSLGKKIAGLAVAGALVAGAGTMAWAETTSGPSAGAASTTAATPSSKAGGKATGKATGKGLALLRRADHGDVEVKVKGKGSGATATWQTVTFDRGQPTDVAADHITLARPDGKSVTLKIDAATKYRGITSWQQVVKSGDAVVVSQSGTATLIIQKAAPTPAA